MPTPNEDVAVTTPPTEPSSSRPTCPPEDLRIPSLQPSRSDSMDASEDVESMDVAVPAQQPTPPAEASSPTHSQEEIRSHAKRLEAEEDGIVRDTPSPVSVVESSDSEQRQAHAPNTSIGSGPGHSQLGGSSLSRYRFLPNSTSSYLRPGSKFRGTQQSDRQVYDVQVEIKYVDMRESFLCGYLRIQGLTDDHPTLTTYFEGEIIGTKYTFQTRHPEWGSNDKVDLQHWGRFPAWKPLAKHAKRSDFSYKNFAERENIFMRWKEYFLVPDHRVRTISGASFEGFYYICFNQVQGSVSGIYFHAKSEKYQQLELQHVEDHGCTGAIEFR